MSQVSHHAAGHAAKLAKETIAELPALHAKKSIALAAVLGFFLGAVGVAVYFRSGKDFFICVGIFFGLSFLLPFGPGELLGWFFSPAYGAWRAHTSNEKLQQHLLT